MTRERVKQFIENLIKKTDEGKVKWQLFSTMESKSEILAELLNGRGGFDFNTNSVRECNSYFLESDEGYVFLFEIYHGDPEVTSSMYDTLGLSIKANPDIPLMNLTDYSDNDEQILLESLRIVAEIDMQNSGSYLNEVDKFMSRIVEA